METKEEKIPSLTLTKSLLNHKRYLFAHFCAASEGQQVHSLISCHCCPAQQDIHLLEEQTAGKDTHTFHIHQT